MSSETIENINKLLIDFKNNYDNDKKEKEQFQETMVIFGLGACIGSLLTTFYIISKYDLEFR
jgi:hypothetical protein